MMGRDPLTPRLPSSGTTTNTPTATGWWTSSATCLAERSEVGEPLLCFPELPVQNHSIPRLPRGSRAPCARDSRRWATRNKNRALTAAPRVSARFPGAGEGRGGGGGGEGDSPYVLQQRAPKARRLGSAATPGEGGPAQALTAALRTVSALMTSARRRRGLRSQEAARASAEVRAPDSGTGARRAR